MWPDPEELCLLLERGKRRHLDAWVAKWGGGDRIDAAIALMWTSSNQGEALLSLANLRSTREGITSAACACARIVLPIVPDDEARPARALETAEAWCAGRASLADVRAAAHAALDAERVFYGASPRGAITAACDAAAFAALSAFGPQVRIHADDSVEHRTADNVAQSVRVAAARHAMLPLVREDPRLADNAIAEMDARAIAVVGGARDRTRSECAARVRQFVPSPRFAELIAVVDPRRLVS